MRRLVQDFQIMKKNREIVTVLCKAAKILML